MNRGELFEPKPGQEKRRGCDRVPDGGGGLNRTLRQCDPERSVGLLRRRHHATGAQPLEAVQTPAEGQSRLAQGDLRYAQGDDPLLIAGTAVYLALKAGLFNIGVEGQFRVGACASAVVALASRPGGAFFLGCGAGMRWVRCGPSGRVD